MSSDSSEVARTLAFRASFKFAESFQHRYLLPRKPISRKAELEIHFVEYMECVFLRKKMRNGNVIPKI